MVAGAVLAGGMALGGVALGRSSPPARSGAAQLTAAHSSALQAGATITVTGSGTVQGAPDTVSFQIGVHSVASTASAALQDNNSRVAALESSLAGSGVSRKDMQTSNLDIYENTNSSGEITGFSVDDDLNVTMRDVSHAGAAIDAAANAVGNEIQFNGVTFSISNQSALLAEARAKAMQNAQTEAEDLAQGAGLSLGAIVKVTDQENAPSQPIMFHGAFANADSVPLQAGQQQLNVQVTVVYALRA